MKVTLDTNVLISATFWKGNEAKIIEFAEKRKVVLVLSKQILAEYENVLNKKFYNIAKEDQIKETIAKITRLSEIVDPKIKVEIVKDDPADDKIIECAITGNSQFIISGDKHLLKIKKIGMIEIVSAKEFLENKKIDYNSSLDMNT